ncbi:MAG TPA: succinate dehydrogenase, hydrophobic membrane anchor protein [Burkholderiaceae bacterium]|nr:succinate dehydrogenase, hydrophobic membrane anchor protein [Burkholderiaceae bacterium]
MAREERLGTKRLVVGAHYGTFDFIVQRVTAVIMIVYTLILFFGYLFTSDMDFNGWRNLFTFSVGALPLGQLLATLAFLSVCWHAWIGVRDIFMDYIRLPGLRLFMHSLAILWLVGTVVYFVKILWSI